MKENDEIISDWGEDKIQPDNIGSLDLRRARRLTTTGSTCNAFETRYHGRRVFVKKLKEEFRHSDRHLQAFSKEYSTGITLTHPSLPTYTEFFGDTIVMNFIDGKTLAAMISEGDNRLRNGSVVRKILVQLVDVLEYLHQHNIIHSDVKADNVIITSNTNNVVLLDFDKCYTDWLDSTSGSPALYGLPDGRSGRPEIDFRGLGKIAERLALLQDRSNRRQLENFANTCLKENISANELRSLLEGNERPFLAKKAQYIIGDLLLIGLLMVITARFLGSGTTSPEMGAMEETEVFPQEQETGTSGPEDLPDRDTPEAGGTAHNRSDSSASLKSQENKPSNNLPSEEQINRELDRLYASLYPLINEMEAMLQDPEATNREILDKFLEMSDLQSELTQEAYRYFEGEYPNINPVEIQMAVASSKKNRTVSEEIARLSIAMKNLSESQTD